MQKKAVRRLQKKLEKNGKRSWHTHFRPLFRRRNAGRRGQGCGDKALSSYSRELLYGLSDVEAAPSNCG